MKLSQLAQRGYAPARLLDPPDDCHRCGKALDAYYRKKLCKECTEMLEYENSLDAEADELATWPA